MYFHLSILQDWKSDFALFESGVKINPMNVKLRNNYGMELKAIGRVEEARRQYLVSTIWESVIEKLTCIVTFLYSCCLAKHHSNILPLLFQKSLEIDPDYYEVYFNLGNLVSDEGDYETAADLYARSEFPHSLCLWGG